MSATDDRRAAPPEGLNRPQDTSTAAADFLLETRGTGRELGAWVVGLAFGRDGSLGLGLGDGTVHIAQPRSPDAAWTSTAAHDGAVLSFCADAKDGYLSGGDDGRLVRIAPDATTQEIAKLGAMKWV